MIRKWLPQNDILAHENVILFIAHGGVFGSMESIWHGVPLLVIPFFGDQHRHAMQATRSGYGKFLPFYDITNETLMNSVQEMLVNKTYLEKAKQVSSIFRTNLAPPMEEAMFWIEYVSKFKGAKHLKSHAVNMSWFSYLLLDVIVLALILIYFIFACFRACCKWCSPRICLEKKKIE